MPDCSCLTLVADPDCPDLIPGDGCLFYNIAYRMKNILIDFFQIMGYPALLINDLSVVSVRTSDDLPVFICQDRFRPLGTLIYS